MKPITKKVIEAGLVDKHTLLLMEKWGYLETGAEELLPNKKIDVRASLSKFVEEVDELLEAEISEDIKETKFSITLQDPFRIVWLYEKNGIYRQSEDPPVVVFTDEADRMIFPASEGPTIGRMYELMSDESWYEITSCTPLWSGDTIVAYQVEADQIR